MGGIGVEGFGLTSLAAMSRKKRPTRENRLSAGGRRDNFLCGRIDRRHANIALMAGSGTSEGLGAWKGQ